MLRTYRASKGTIQMIKEYCGHCGNKTAGDISKKENDQILWNINDIQEALKNEVDHLNFEKMDKYILQLKDYVKEAHKRDLSIP